MKKIILLAFIFLIKISNAQNLIQNGSFEQYDTVPYTDGQIKFAKYWMGIGSPDYFHEYSTIISGVNIPYTFPGIMPKTPDGLGCAGICTYLENWDNYREYLVTKLDVPLIIGKIYTLRINVLTTIPNPIYGGWTSDNFGILLSKSKPKKDATGVIAWQPQLIQPMQLFAANWKELSYTFIADSAYKYVIIGCFINDSIQQRHQTGTTLLFDAVYTYIDNVSLYNDISTSMEIIFHKPKKYNTKQYNLLGSENKNDVIIRKENIIIR